MESKSKSPVHLCDIIDTCCLNKISRAVLTEILKFVIFFILFSILLEFVELVLILLYRTFFCGEETQTNEINHSSRTTNIPPNLSQSNQNANQTVKQNASQTVSQSKTKALFGSSVNLPSYEFNFV